MADEEKVDVKRFAGEEAEIAVFEFQGELRDLLLTGLRKSYLSTGRYAVDSKALSPQGLLSMVSLGGSAASTGLSAALNTVITMKQFKEVNRKLDELMSILKTAFARSEATHTAELIAASAIVDEIDRQYELEGSFSHDMLIRLAFAEHDVRKLAERFRYLVETHPVTEVENIAETNFDVRSAILASFLDLRVAYLRLCVDAQENPKSVGSSTEQLKRKISADVKFWQELLQRSRQIKEAIQQGEGSLNDMAWAERYLLPSFVGGKGAATEKKVAALKEALMATLESELGIIKGFDSLIESAKDTLSALENPKPAVANAPTLVYWRDELGEHSFSSESIRLA
jgi:hypothetical protein